MPLHLGGQVPAVDELHDQEMARLGLVGVVGHDDVRVAQAGDRLHLALEPLDELLGLADAAGQDLDGHHPLHAAVPGLVHRPHAAGPRRSSTW